MLISKQTSIDKTMQVKKKLTYEQYVDFLLAKFRKAACNSAAK